MAVLGWCALLPFVLFSLISPGTMLERGAAGRVMVVLCASGGPVPMVVAADGSLQKESEHVGRHRCEWAQHAQPAMAMAAIMPDRPAMDLAPLRFARALPDGLPRMDVLAPLARGPPPPA